MILIRKKNTMEKIRKIRPIPQESTPKELNKTLIATWLSKNEAVVDLADVPEYGKYIY